MVSCRLCGYRGYNDTNTQCPVCGEAYDRPQDGHMQGSRLAQAAGGSWCAASQQKSRSGGLDGCNSAEGATGSTYHLNLDLQSLLHLIPEQQDRKKRAQDVVWATGAGLTPTQADDGRRDPDVVYIQPRVDPTMTVLKGRYNTQPRIAKATSMSALNRLAHPLMGYDSMGALAPKARKRRQESVERLLGQALNSGKMKGGGQARLINKSRSAVELSEPPAKNTFLQRRSFGGGIPPRTPMAISVHAVHLQGRKKSVGLAAPQQRRQHRRDSRGRLIQTRELAAASPLLRLRASEGRGAKPTLRRKRVATMRSVDGWVRETNPASTRRQVSLDRRMVALRKRGNKKPRDRRKESRPLRDSGGGTFLTELQTDGALSVVETGLSQGHGGTGSWVNGCDAQRRRNSVKANKARHHPRVGGRGSNSGIAQRQQVRRHSSGAKRGPASTEFRTRRATAAAKIPGRSRSEGTRVKVRAGRTKSVGALDRYREQQTSPSRTGLSSVRSGAGDRGQEARVGQAPAPAPAPPQPPELLGELSAGRVVTGNPADWTSSHPGGAWNSPSPVRATDCGVTPGTAELTVKATTGQGTDAHEADTTMAPAWGVSGSYATSPLPDASRLAWQGDEPGPSTRPCSEWQLLRGAGNSSLSRSAELLRSFGNKVGSPFSEEGRRPASATAASNDETTSQQKQPLLPDGEHGGGRHRHHRPLSREEETRDGTPPFPTKSSLASMHNRPGSSSWVHRRSLPSLLSNRPAESPPLRQQTKAASTPSKESSGGATARKRGKRRPSLEEPSGRMQRLDKTSSTVTVGDAIARSGGSSSGGAGENRGRKSVETKVASPGNFGEGREAGAATSPQVEFESGLDGRAGSAGSFRRGSTSSGNLLSSATPKPLLYVGSGGGSGFRLRS